MLVYVKDDRRVAVKDSVMVEKMEIVTAVRKVGYSVVNSAAYLVALMVVM